MSHRRASVTTKSNEALDRLVSSAREERPTFDPRASLAGALAKREQRARRAKTIRRSVVALSSASFLLLLLVRASASPSADRATASATETSRHEPIAARTLDDGGYARD